MKKFETPIIDIEMFDLVNIVTTSGETPVEPEKQTATALAAAEFGDGEGKTKVAQTFTITL